jgi:gamma-glutamyl:cysteine ligase YbdK (ATP-grasp superfamily)
MSNGPSPPAARLDAPNVELDAPTVLPESLITSIQPHYQVATAADLPERFNYALRVAGPLLALAANSPFFPPDLYTTDDADRVLAEAHAEHRVTVFESTLNRPDARKVRFPADLDTTEQAVQRLVDDPQVVPMPPTESDDRFDDAFARLRHKNGSFWRWVRPVFDGATRSAANVRIEFRPIGAQPTVRDSVAFFAAFAGLMERLPAVDHPVADLPWEAARENFYAAARDGIASDQRWITADGEETTRRAAVYEDLFARGVEGLCDVGLAHDEAEAYLAPLRARVRADRDPATWKRARARARVDAGADLASAVRGAQRDYLDRQAETLLDGSFAAW